jgi:hypothetical protein
MPKHASLYIRRSRQEDGSKPKYKRQGPTEREKTTKEKNYTG